MVSSDVLKNTDGTPKKREGEQHAVLQQPRRQKASLPRLRTSVSSPRGPPISQQEGSLMQSHTRQREEERDRVRRSSNGENQPVQGRQSTAEELLLNSMQSPGLRKKSSMFGQGSNMIAIHHENMHEAVQADLVSEDNRTGDMVLMLPAKTCASLQANSAVQRRSSEPENLLLSNLRPKDLTSPTGMELRRQVTMLRGQGCNHHAVHHDDDGVKADLVSVGNASGEMILMLPAKGCASVQLPPSPAVKFIIEEEEEAERQRRRMQIARMEEMEEESRRHEQIEFMLRQDRLGSTLCTHTFCGPSRAPSHSLSLPHHAGAASASDRAPSHSHGGSAAGVFPHTGPDPEVLDWAGAGARTEPQFLAASYGEIVEDPRAGPAALFKFAPDSLVSGGGVPIARQSAAGVSLLGEEALVPGGGGATLLWGRSNPPLSSSLLPSSAEPFWPGADYEEVNC